MHAPSRLVEQGADRRLGRSGAMQLIEVLLDDRRCVFSVMRASPHDGSGGHDYTVFRDG